MGRLISVIIAHRDMGDTADKQASQAALGLWATIHSIQEDLESAGYDYGFSIYVNGAEKFHPDTTNVLYYLKQTGRLDYEGYSPVPVAPPIARQRAVDNSNGEYLFFFDNHVIVKPGYFKQAMQSMEKYGLEMLHSTTRFYYGQPDCYHYHLCLQKNFWAEASFNAPSQEPYQIAAGGHGGFAVRRDVWNAVGGYGWDGFRGYGGEEIYFDLKMNLLGRKNWIDPKMIHYHFAGNRGYHRHYTDDYFMNMMGVANIIGGEKWLHTVQESFRKNYFKISTGRSIFDLMVEADERSREHAAWLDSKRICTLDELLVKFKENNIAH